MPSRLRSAGLAVLASAAATLALAAPAAAQWVALSPGATFLRTDGNDAPAAAAIVDLTGVAAGASFTLTSGASRFLFTIHGTPSYVNAPYVGVFSATSTVLGSDLQLRVPGAIAPAPNPFAFVTGPTLFGGLATDIAEDMRFRGGPGTTFTLQKPTGANYLLLGLTDSFYGDNAAENAATFGFTVALPQSTVPEPGTVALLASGLLVVAGVARRRARTA